MPSVTSDELIGITFRADWAKDEEVSVFVDNNLTRNSLTEDVVIDGELFLELGCLSYEPCKYLIHKQSGGKLTPK